MWLRQLTAVIGVALASSLQGSTLEISFEHLIGNRLVRHDSLRYENSSGEDYSSTRLSYLVSGFALQSVEGEWITPQDNIAWIDSTRSRAQHRLGSIPNNKYRAVAFYVGVSPKLNHADPAQFPADHPLNPNLNNLHWNWQGGYIFMALEGHWRGKEQSAIEGYAYHYATDAMYTRVELPIQLDINDNSQITIGLDLSRILDGLSFEKDGATTHSAQGDPVSIRIQENLTDAFRILNTGAKLKTPPVGKLQPIDLPTKPTAYPINLPRHVPIPELPLDNPIIKERVALGEKLFHDPHLSRDNSVACVSCHQDENLSDPHRFSTGIDGKVGSRHTMPLFNLAWKKDFTWDGSASSLREHALMPIEDHMEMDSTHEAVVEKLRAKPEYIIGFKEAFGSGEINPANIGLAIENFLLTRLSLDSKIDQVKAGLAEFTSEQARGFELFFTESEPRLGKAGADCFHCHGGAMFTDHLFHNNGLPGEDLGLYLTTHRESDRRKFSTPSLRNISETAPYMHDGRFQSLEEVIDHYNGSFERSDTLDPNLAKHPGGLSLSQADKNALIAFLETL